LSRQTEDMIVEFISTESKLSWLYWSYFIPRESEFLQRVDENSGISYAAREGLDNIVGRVLAEGSTHDAEGHWTGPGLFHAIRSREDSTVKLCLEAGTDVNL
jgi:hypothetical protein